MTNYSIRVFHDKKQIFGMITDSYDEVLRVYNSFNDDDNDIKVYTFEREE